MAAERERALVDRARSDCAAFGELYDVTLAEGGRQAISILEQSRFDLIVCDILMPEVSGMEVFNRVRQMHSAPGDMVVFVTDSIGQREVQAFLRASSNQVLEKPLDFSVLHEMIHARFQTQKGQQAGDQVEEQT